MLNKIANIGLVLAVLLALTPFGMRAYGKWAEKRARAAVFSGPAVADAPLPRPAQSRQKGVRVRHSTPQRRPWEPSVIQISAIGVDAVVQKGEGNWRMIPGPAYEPASAGPGGVGNPVIAAHRNMWDETFMDLPRLRPGNTVTILTRTHRYKYVVDTSKQVGTMDTRYLADTPDARLTLYTCILPFNANRRWLVQAHLADAAATDAPLAHAASAERSPSSQSRSASASG